MHALFDRTVRSIEGSRVDDARTMPPAALEEGLGARGLRNQADSAVLVDGCDCGCCFWTTRAGRPAGRRRKALEQQQHPSAATSRRKRRGSRLALHPAAAADRRCCCIVAGICRCGGYGAGSVHRSIDRSRRVYYCCVRCMRSRRGDDASRRSCRSPPPVTGMGRLWFGARVHIN